MRARIARHRSARPAAWFTVEAPTDAGPAILRAETDVVLLDCVAVLSANALGSSAPPTKMRRPSGCSPKLTEYCRRPAGRAGTLILVTNDVGFSVHPTTRLGRWF